MNLRDKLRANNGQEAGATDADWDANEATEKSSPVKKSKRGIEMPQLDINRRFLVLAAATAFLAAALGVMVLKNSASGLAEAGEKVEVVVLAEDVQRGVSLTEERLTTASIPRMYLPKGAIEAGEDQQGLKKTQGMVALAPMVAGEPVISLRVGEPNRRLGIAYLLKRGERAKTINVDSASGLAGLIKPGNEVDLIATIPDPNNDSRRIGTPVLQKARVIAVGKHLLGELRKEEDDESTDESGGIASDSTITLAIAAGKIGLVTLLEDLGNLKVVLRADDDTTIQKTPFSDEAIMALVSGKVPARSPSPPPPAPPAPRVIIREAAPPRPAPRPRVVPRPAPMPPKPAAVEKPPRKPRTPQVIRFGQD
ncbi:MAG: Flp pilus assembly protein CpaB [Candidatus Sericytochromatia bacterium]|nr:Flp pilus assembly protein CpaB [Candidatus Sericytochromatia bacterium]